jgi:hypothetical protein
MRTFVIGARRAPRSCPCCARAQRSLRPAISLFLLRNPAVWTRLGQVASLRWVALSLTASSPSSPFLLPLPPWVCRSVSGTQKVGLPKSEFLAPATRLWSGFRPSSTLPGNSLAVQHRVLLSEKVTFGPFGYIVGIFFPPLPFAVVFFFFFERAFL